VGQITANGGNAVGINAGDSHGGGGGGRVAVFYENAAEFDLNRITAFGGLRSATATHGGAGTVYLQGPERQVGELIFDNNNVLAPSFSTPVIALPTGLLNLTHMSVRKGANVRVDDQLILTGTLDVSLGLGVSSGLSIAQRVIASTITVTNESARTS
jgi:hypothetical protein